MAKQRHVAAAAAALLALQLAACAVPAGKAEDANGAEERAAAMATLEDLGLRNIAGLRVNGPISEGYATYQAERVRFLYDTRDGNLRTWDFMPPVP